MEDTALAELKLSPKHIKYLRESLTLHPGLPFGQLMKLRPRLKFLQYVGQEYGLTGPLAVLRLFPDIVTIRLEKGRNLLYPATVSESPPQPTLPAQTTPTYRAKTTPEPVQESW